MVIQSGIKFLALGLMGVSVCSSGAFSRSLQLAQQEVIGDDGYNKTYDDPNKSFKEKMRGAREKPEVTVSNEKGGLYLGILGAFGPVYDAEPTSSSGMGFQVGVDPGYVIQGDSWSRIEFGVAVAMNSFDWKDSGTKVTMAPMTIVPHVGLGSSLGNNLFGVAKLGFGMAMNSAVTSKTNGTTCKSDSPSGFVFSGDYDVVYKASAFQFVGGIGATHHKYSFSSLTCSGTKYDNVDIVTNLNFVNAHGGIRLQF